MFKVHKKTLEQRRRSSSVFIVHSEHTSHRSLVLYY